jgi:uncharacterized protein (TIGR02145 family)
MKTVNIGGQEWMLENLNLDHYRNGDPIPQVQVSIQWRTLNDGAWHNNCNADPENTESKQIYGKLYNWYAVNDQRCLAPEGWHIPTNKEWQTLIDHLGGSEVAGGKLKETGTAHWRLPNTSATNEGGFTALPGGYFDDNGLIFEIGYSAQFWSSTEEKPEYDFTSMEYKSLRAWGWELSNNESRISHAYGGDFSFHKRCGLSVRCVRD